jgi:hypothetical protein
MVDLFLFVQFLEKATRIDSAVGMSWDDTLDPAVSYKIGQVICCCEPPFIFHLPF